jgi:hypothetical protein
LSAFAADREAKSIFICGFAQFAALIAICGGPLQHGQQQGLSLGLAVN